MPGTTREGKGLPYQDTPYSWLVLAACVGLELLYASGVGTIGVLIVHLTETFNVRKSALTWIGGLLLFVGFILGFIPSSLARRYGCRPVGIVASLVACGSFLISAFSPSVNLLYLSHGILASMSLCTFFNLASISGQQYFHKRRSLASGITMASISAGILIWPLACQALINFYGWRGAFMLIAGLQLHGVVFSALIRPIPKQKPLVYAEMEDLGQSGLTKQNEHQILVKESQEYQRSNSQMDADANAGGMNTNQKTLLNTDSYQSQTENRSLNVKSKCQSIGGFLKDAFQPIANTPHYTVYLLSIFLIQTGHITAISMLPLLSRRSGLSKTLGASVLSILGGTGGISRPLSGLLGDWKMVNRSLVVGASGIVSGLITCVMGYLGSYVQLAAVAAVLGLTSGAYNALQGACVIDYVGRQQMAAGVGLLSIAMGLGRLSALLISGVVLDLLGDPKYVFVMFGLIETFGGLLLPILVTILKCRRKSSASSEL